MVEKKSKRSGRGGPKLSPALRRAIAADTIGCFVDNAVLAKRDVAALQKILAGQETPGLDINRKRALGALARSDRSAETGELLAQVLADRKLPHRDRAAAAAYLGLLSPPAAEKPLLAALRKTSGLLRVEVIKALGQVGTAKALTQLRKIELDDDDPARRQLGLAELAIAFREKRKGTGPDDLSDALDIRWTTTEATRLDARAVRETLAALGGPTYGVTINPRIGFRFDCGSLQHVVLLNEALKRGSFVKGVRERNMIAGLLVSQAEKLRYFSVRWLLLTSPAKDGVRMVLARPNGDPAFEGQAVAEDGALRFTLRDTGLERTPAEISGFATDDDIDWTMRVWRGPLRGKLRPRPLTGSVQTL
jgi:hypothetical protein